jgi:hypothetical protein
MKVLLTATKTLVLTAFFATSLVVQAQVHTQKLEPFSKLVVSPVIEVILIKGTHESVRWEFSKVAQDKLNVDQDGNTLHLFLEDARIIPKNQKDKDQYWDYKESIYKHARVKAYITYRELSSIEIRGEERVTSQDPIESKNFKLKLYGDTEAYFPSINSERFKAILYGENTLEIGGGQAANQSYRCYGENIVDASHFKGEDVSTTIFGESELNLNATGTMKVTALGEGKVHYRGNARLNKGLILGETNISRHWSDKN